MADVISEIDGSLIQHGRHNNRIYLMKLGVNDVVGTIERLDEIAVENKYTKIVAKVPGRARAAFEEHDYRVEATVPGFYNGIETAFFMGKYLDSSRKIKKHSKKIGEVLTASFAKAREPLDASLDERFTMTIGDESDAEQISGLYRTVFESYPFPILETEYILQTMRENVVYFCIRDGDTLVSVASSEMDEECENVEMTDFATHPEYLGHGFAVYLLQQMEERMRDRGLKTAYTIARSLSYGMNITFAKLQYKYAGTLTNNTDICGSLESMNIWYKPLQ